MIPLPFFDIFLESKSRSADVHIHVLKQLCFYLLCIIHSLILCLIAADVLIRSGILAALVFLESLGFNFRSLWVALTFKDIFYFTCLRFSMGNPDTTILLPDDFHFLSLFCHYGAELLALSELRPSSPFSYYVHQGIQ